MGIYPYVLSTKSVKNQKDKEIRRKILKILYKAKSEDIYYKVHRDDLLQELNIPGEETLGSGL